MRNLTLFLLLLLALPAVTSAQVCGDADGNGHVDLGDLSYIVAYLLEYAPAPPNPANADVDDHAQITQADVVRLIQWLTSSGQVPLDCSPSQSYSFALSQDTLFLPRTVNIPDGVDEVYLPIETYLLPGSRSFYYPILQRDPFATMNFRLDSVIMTPIPGFSIENDRRVYESTESLVIMASSDQSLDGRHKWVTLKYIRTAPGVGQVRPALFEIDPYRKTSIENASDLFVPVISYVEIPLPPDSLRSSLSSFSFTARAGKPSQDTFDLNLMSSGAETPFTLTASDEWIRLVNYTGPGTTPATIRVTAHAELLVAGNYSGSITLSSSDPEVVADPTTIPVNVTVLPPIVFPSGDYNCDGVIDLSDLARMVGYLVMHLPLPPPCY